MRDYADVITKTGDQVITAVKGAQDRTLATVTSLVDRVNAAWPNEAPEPPERVTALLVGSEKAVEAGFDLAARALEVQKEYALKFGALFLPKTAPARRARPARKATAAS